MAGGRWRRRGLAVAVSLLAVASTAILLRGGLHSTAVDRQPTHTAMPAPASLAGRPSQVDEPGPFDEAPADVAAVAQDFAASWLSYDARRETRAAVLDRVVPHAVPELRDRLLRSPRLRLRWRVLRGRDERVQFTPLSTSTMSEPQPSAAAPVTVEVTGWLHTTTDTAKLVTPQSLQLQLSSGSDGWRVVRVHGGGS